MQLIEAIPANGNGVHRPPEPDAVASGGCASGRVPASPAQAQIQPNALVRWVFWLSVFALPFARLYLPGTGNRVGTERLVQGLMLIAVASQPGLCLRWVPVALFWFGAYAVVRLAAGFWLSPEWAWSWGRSTFAWIQFSFPWVWVLFNLFQFQSLRRSGLWALGWGCALCAVCHGLGIGTVELDQGLEGRSAIFGQNANEIATMYGVAIVALAGLAMLKETRLRARWLAFGLLAVVGLGLAKTGSRTGLITVVLGALVLLLDCQAFLSKARRYGSLLLLAALLGAVFLQSPAVMQRFEKVRLSDLQEQEGRVRMFPVLWDIFLRSPIYGSGPDAYQFELTRRAMPRLIREQKTISAHNMMLCLLAETGLIGFGLFWVGLGKALASAWRARRNSFGLVPLALLLPLALSGLVISNPIHNQFFWLAIAYALAEG